MPASRRVSSSERFRAQLDELSASGRELRQGRVPWVNRPGFHGDSVYWEPATATGVDKA